MTPEDQATALAIYNEIKPAIQELAGDASFELRFWLGEELRFRRLKRVLRKVKPFLGKLREAGIDPISIDLKVLSPLLDGASLEKDDDMQARWAALLCQAMNPNEEKTAHVSYPKVLAEMEALDALVLEQIYDHYVTYHSNKPKEPFIQWPYAGILLDDLQPRCGISSENAFELSIGNLLRSGCIERVVDEFQISAPFLGSFKVGITQFGIGFVQACRMPQL